MLKRKLEVFGKRLFVTGIVLGLFLAGCAGNPEVTSDAGAVEKEEVVDSKEGDVLQEQEVQAEDERQEEVAGNSFDSQELDDSSGTSDQNEEDDVLAFLQEIRGNIFTDEQLYDIYGNIGEIVKNEYLDPNGIDHNAFKWPDSKDEDNAWVYLEYIITKYKTSGKLYNHEGFTDELPSEQNQQLMNSVLDGIISCNKLNEEFTVENIDQALLPIREKIPANVNFSD